MSDTDDKKSLVARIEALIDQWHFESFHGSIVARETEIWNFVHAAKESLKKRIEDLWSPPQA